MALKACTLSSMKRSDISHRFSTVRMADRIPVLKNGRLVEEGSHSHLVALSGKYSQLFELQAAEHR